MLYPQRTETQEGGLEKKYIMKTKYFIKIPHKKIKL